MTSREDFSTSEWNMLSRAPAMAGLAVLAAQPDGTVKETQAFLDAWDKAVSQPFANNQLVLTIIRERDAQGQHMRFLAADSEWFSSISAADALTAAEAACRDAVSLLRAKGATQEADALRQFIIYLMQHVASANKTGGVLGIGGTSVTDSEKRAMDAISASLLPSDS